MINELIENEIEKLLYGKCEDVTFDKVREACRTIAKEVAMRFKEHNYGSYYINKDKIELLANKIINEVSE